jgi:hypothetical protein
MHRGKAASQNTRAKSHAQGEIRATEHTSPWVMHREKAAPQNTRANMSCTGRKPRHRTHEPMGMHSEKAAPQNTRADVMHGGKAAPQNTRADMSCTRRKPRHRTHEPMCTRRKPRHRTHEPMGHGQGESRATERTSPCVIHSEKAAPQNTRTVRSCTYRKIGPTGGDKCFVDVTASYSLGLRTVLQRNRPVCLNPCPECRQSLHPAKPLTNECKQIQKTALQPTTSPGSHSGTADDVTPCLFHPDHGSSTVLRNVENSVVSQKT